jgi:hypothetical protein
MMDADNAFVRAMKTDAATLEPLLDPDFTWTTAQGQVLTRAQVLVRLPNFLLQDPRGLVIRISQHTYGDLASIRDDSGRAHVLRVWAKRPTGWKIIVYQELLSLDAPPTFTPGAGKECENPCKSIGFTPTTDIERQIAAAYMKLETAAHARNAAGFAPMVADEFIAASSNSDVIQTKADRIATFTHAKDSGIGPTPLLSARMFAFNGAVLMTSEHKPANRGNPLHVTRIWVHRDGGWRSALSFQTAVTAP